MAAFAPLVGHVVVVDTKAPQIVYIGTLDRVDAHGLVLKDVDVHDLDETRTPKEVYVMESKKFGVKANRKQVTVALSEVVSASLLDDVIVY